MEVFNSGVSLSMTLYTAVGARAVLRPMHRRGHHMAMLASEHLAHLLRFFKALQGLLVPHFITVSSLYARAELHDLGDCMQVSYLWLTL